MGSIGINRLVSDAFIKYDHNLNGVIELEAPEDVTAISVTQQSQRVESLTVSGKSVSASSKQVETRRIDVDRLDLKSRAKVDERMRYDRGYYFTQNHLFAAADANKDKRLTREELHSFIARNYDKNNNGELETTFWFWEDDGESDKFYNDFDERGLQTHPFKQ